jgi:hypothetical protein
MPFKLPFILNDQTVPSLQIRVERDAPFILKDQSGRRFDLE